MSAPVGSVLDAAPLRSRSGAYEVISLSSSLDIPEHANAWAELAKVAIEPNCFYEHWALAPALELFGGASVQILLVYYTDRSGRRQMVAVLPLQFSDSFHHFPLPCVRLWQHPHCYLTTPLVHPQHLLGAWEHLFAWLNRQRSGGVILEADRICADGPVFQALMQVTCGHRIPLDIADVYTRATLRIGDDPERYLNECFSGEERKRIRRRRRNLEELGKVEVKALWPKDDPAPWLQAFLKLEASGWKGQEGTAMACDPRNREYFLRTSESAHSRGRLMMVQMAVDGRPAAIQYGMYAGEGAFALKSCYAEEFHQHSPGMMLKVEEIQLFFGERRCKWIDSCAAAGSTWMKQVWQDERSIARAVCPSGRGPASLLTSALPLVRQFRSRAREFLRRPEAAAAAVVTFT